MNNESVNLWGNMVAALFEALPRHLSGDTKNPSQDSQDLKQVPQGKEA
jgi:hypothetical protein